MTVVTDTEMSPRRTQPKCAREMTEGRCNHPHSFHGKDKGPCKALGCHCPGWVAPQDDEE